MNTFKITTTTFDSFNISADFYSKKDGWIKFYKYGDEYDYPIHFLTRPTRFIKAKHEIVVKNVNEYHIISIETIDKNKI